MVSLISRERDRKLGGGIKNITDITAPLTVREEYLGATLLLCKLVFGHHKTSYMLSREREHYSNSNARSTLQCIYGKR